VRAQLVVVTLPTVALFTAPLALTQVEVVGLWAGLISSIVAIVLSVVAIAFTRDVDRRSMEISSQTIRSLEAIEAAVQRLSDDTGGLIKVAWERMLGSMGAREQPADTELQTLLAALLAEFRDDVAAGSDVDKLVRDLDERLRRAAGRRAQPERGTAPRSWAFNAAVDAIRSVSPLAVELLRSLASGRPLTRAQYRQLRQDPDLAVALDELRDQDLLMPFQRGPKGEQTAYGLAPWFHDVIGPALVFTDHESPVRPEADRVMEALGAVGYPVEQLADRSQDAKHSSGTP
jgi:hypothetical protein